MILVKKKGENRGKEVKGPRASGTEITRKAESIWNLISPYNFEKLRLKQSDRSDAWHFLIRGPLGARKLICPDTVENIKKPGQMPCSDGWQ